MNKLWGLPVCATEKQREKFVRIECDGSAWGVEDELDKLAKTPPTREPAPLAPNKYSRSRA